jgi:hypothetical protein
MTKTIALFISTVCILTGFILLFANILLENDKGILIGLLFLCIGFLIGFIGFIISVLKFRKP